MTPERAKEILANGSRWSNYSKHATPSEDAEIRAYWAKLPGWSSYYTALCAIAYPKPQAVTFTHAEMIGNILAKARGE